jgi:hypothetical protein
MSTHPLRPLLGTTLALALGLFGAASSEARADTANAPKTTVQSSLFRGATESADAPRAVNQYFGWGVLYVPPWFKVVDGKYDLIVHFHGGHHLQVDNMERARINAVVVSVNLGINTGPYSDVYGAPGALDRLLTKVQEELDKTHRATGAKLGRVALTAWSAGFASIGGILSQPGNAQRIDAVLIGDGFHTAFLNPYARKMYTPPLEKWKSYAEMAMRGEKLFAMTHSSVGTDGYASTTETTNEFLREMSLDKTPNTSTGPRGMKEIYEVNKGDFHVKGFEGTEKPDHIDHIKGMYDLTLPYLKARWSKGS